MSDGSAAPTFSQQLWDRVAPIRRAIDQLPFVDELRRGVLEENRFRYYMTQDAIYLDGFARALSSAAAQSMIGDDLVFWAEAARAAVLVERSLHAAYGADLTSGQASPTGTAYASHLAWLAARGEYPTLAAGLLPCFWIYEDVGNRIKENVPDITAHPYREWVMAYGDPVFAKATLRARGVIDRLAREASPGTRRRMQEAFVTSCRYEWMFWDAAYGMETWPV
ncbi:MAG TPA: TenA family protein [Dermatophilaceae bacterium]|nr:TenA family protein [Dermatophilaceae bacterium]